MSEAAYHLKYRPTTLEQVVGQPSVTKSLREVLDKNLGRTFLFTSDGVPGVGKTTLARVIASEKKIDPRNIQEVDAAANSEIEKIRELTKDLDYAGFGENPLRMIIVDEIQRLSKSAMDVLLKVTEEPPPHLYWVFCTTEPKKVPDTLRSRCVARGYNLQPIPDKIIFNELCRIADLEQLPGAPDAVLHLIVRQAEGSLRNALVMLAAVGHCQTAEEAAPILDTTITLEADLGDFMRLLSNGERAWSKFMPIVQALQASGTPAESLRYPLCAWFMKAAMNARTGQEAAQALSILEAFSTPYNPQAGFSPFLLSLGKLCFIRKD